MKEIEFNACKYLDFSDNYTANKELIHSQGTTKVCWNRPVIDETYPKLVQFCKRRGRLNHPTACLSDCQKMCNDYEESTHKVQQEGIV